MNLFCLEEKLTQCDVCFSDNKKCVLIETTGYDPWSISVCKDCLTKMIDKFNEDDNE